VKKLFNKMFEEFIRTLNEIFKSSSVESPSSPLRESELEVELPNTVPVPEPQLNDTSPVPEVQLPNPSHAPEPQVPVPNFKRVTIEREPEHPNDSIRQILRELKEMNSANFDNEQVRVSLKDDNPRQILVTLAPDDGLYRDGEYVILMTLPDTYPKGKPTFKFESQIFHPNVNYSGDICFSLLDESNEGLRIADYAHGLLWLLYYPNLYSRLNMDCPRDQNQFAEMVRRSIVGGTIADRNYKRSPRLPSLKEEEKGMDKACNLQSEKNGKKWMWKLVGEDWVQVFE
jgi:ubiquitin-conjugating enzyme E2 M